MCINNNCRTPKEHGIKLCPTVDGVECNGLGVCEWTLINYNQKITI